MNPVVAAAAVKAGSEAKKGIDTYVSNVGNAVLNSPESQEEMEKKLNLPKGSINKMADGKDDPKLSTVIGIATILGMSLDKVTGYAAEKREEKAKKKEEKAKKDATKSAAELKLEEQNKQLETLKANIDSMIDATNDPRMERVLGRINGSVGTILENSAIPEEEPEIEIEEVQEVIEQEPVPTAAESKIKAYKEKMESMQNLAEDKGLFSGVSMGKNGIDVAVR